MRRTFALAAVAVFLKAGAAAASVASIKHEIRAKFGPAHDATALCIARVESRFRWWVVSPTDDVGVFQVNYLAHRRSGESLRIFVQRFQNVQRNINFAYQLSRGGRDWSPWSTYSVLGLCHGLT